MVVFQEKSGGRGVTFSEYFGGGRVHVLFIRKVFSLSTETFLTFLQFQGQNFLKTLLAKIFEFQCLTHTY